MKKLLDGRLWEYKDGQLHTWGGRDNKYLGYISFDIDFDPLSGEGKIEFKSLSFPALNKEIDFEYFKDWCVLIANCFNYTSYKKDKITKLMWDIGYFFDGISFEDEYDRNTLLQDIAAMKDYNFDFENISAKKRPPFETNGVERILTFDHCNRAEDSGVYRVIIKDNNKNQFDLQYLDDAFYVFDDKINYTFVKEKEFDKIFNSFFENDDEWTENHNLKF